MNKIVPDWWTPFIGKVQNAGIFYPEENWIALTSVNGLKLMTYRFHRDYPKALVFIFHGMFGESNEASHIAKRLYDAGYAVMSMDHECHGKSEGKRGHIKSYNALSQDSENYINKTRKHYPENCKIFIMGLSMGATITAMLALSLPEIINGILLFAPALGVQPNLEPFLQRAVRLLNVCCGCVKLKKLDGVLCTRNTDYIKFSEVNPLAYNGRMSVKAAVNTLDGLAALQIRANEITVPVVVIQGGMDKVINADMNQRFISTCKSKDVDYWFYEEMFHDIFHEPEIYEIMEKCVDWIDRRT